jgi:hypothetical protein
VPSLQRLKALGVGGLSGRSWRRKRRRRSSAWQSNMDKNSYGDGPNFRGFKYMRPTENIELLWFLQCFPAPRGCGGEMGFTVTGHKEMSVMDRGSSNISRTHNVLDPSWLDMNALLGSTTMKSPLDWRNCTWS